MVIIEIDIEIPFTYLFGYFLNIIQRNNEIFRQIFYK